MVRVAILALAVGPAPVRALAPGLAGALAPAEALALALARALGPIGELAKYPTRIIVRMGLLLCVLGGGLCWHLVKICSRRALNHFCKGNWFQRSIL